MDHDTYLNTYLVDILASTRTVAVVGASPRADRPSHWICGFLLGKGYRVFPINPNHAGQIILGQRVHARLQDIPHALDMVNVFRRTEYLDGIVDEVLSLDPRPASIWCQLGIRDDRAAARAEQAGVKVVMNRALVSEYPLLYELPHRQRAASSGAAA